MEEPSENDKKLGTKIEASREADKKMQKYIDSGKELSAQGKKDLADGLLPYAVGMASMISPISLDKDGMQVGVLLFPK